MNVCRFPCSADRSLFSRFDKGTFDRVATSEERTSLPTIILQTLLVPARKARFVKEGGLLVLEKVGRKDELARATLADLCVEIHSNKELLRKEEQ